MTKGGQRAWDGTPAYSPDGKYIAYRLQQVPGYESDRFRLAIYDRAAKKSTVLTEKFDNWIMILNGLRQQEYLLPRSGTGRSAALQARYSQKNHLAGIDGQGHLGV